MPMRYNLPSLSDVDGCKSFLYRWMMYICTIIMVQDIIYYTYIVIIIYKSRYRLFPRTKYIGRTGSVGIYTAAVRGHKRFH